LSVDRWGVIIVVIACVRLKVGFSFTNVSIGRDAVSVSFLDSLGCGFVGGFEEIKAVLSDDAELAREA
jgi:hypothetical protein